MKKKDSACPGSVIKFQISNFGKDFFFAKH